MTVIYELAKEKTVIMISHRLANAINSNNIFVINNGTVVENGTHTKLIEQSGYYAELFNKQQNLENFNKGGVNNDRRSGYKIMSKLITLIKSLIHYIFCCCMGVWIFMCHIYSCFQVLLCFNSFML